MPTQSRRTIRAGVRTQRGGCAPTRKKCEACGATFDCGAPDRGCWCEGVQLNGDVARNLRARFAGCLCPTCLTAHATDRNRDQRE